MMRIGKLLALAPILLLVTISCKGPASFFHKSNPYEEYLESLNKSNLSSTALGTQWINAGQNVFSGSMGTPLPHQETICFHAESPGAFGFRFSGKEGSILNFRFRQEVDEGQRVFINLFNLKDDEWNTLISVQDTSLLTYKVRRSGEFLLRVQPEILAEGCLNVTITHQASLAFPVAGGTQEDIWSVFGDPRGGGARKHHGVDIFAPRNTPVLAAADGRISRVQETTRGGRVIWLRDAEQQLNLYYAHLEKQLVSPGQIVETGDTLGLVGNSGNAVTTPPHLHFGIYSYGPRDPYQYIVSGRELREMWFDVEDEWVKTRFNNNNIRNAPGMSGTVIHELPQDVPLKVTGSSDQWYRVELPDKSTGYAHHSITRNIDANAQQVELEKDLFVYNRPGGVPIGKVRTAEVLGSYDSYWLVKKDSLQGWMVSI